MINIIPYSAKKNKVNPAPPYSILKPDTNSLSPSERSNGARLVSAKKTIKNPKIINIKNSPLGKCQDFNINLS